MPQYLVLYPVDWKGEILEPGAVVTAASPEDDPFLEYVAKFSKLAAMPEEAPPGGEDPGGTDQEAPGESGSASATPPMTSTDMPSHVGRRVRHSTTA